MPAGRAASPQVRPRIKWLLISNIISKYCQQSYNLLQYNLFARQVLPPRLLQVPGVLSRDPGRLLHHRDQPRLSQLLQGCQVKIEYLHIWQVLVLSHNISVFKMLGATEGEIFFMQGQVSLWERLQGTIRFCKNVCVIISIGWKLPRLRRSYQGPIRCWIKEIEPS